MEGRKDVLEASVAIRSKISFTKELRMAIALLEIPVSGCTCLSTKSSHQPIKFRIDGGEQTFVDVRRVSLLSRLLASLLLLALDGYGSFLSSLLGSFVDSLCGLLRSSRGSGCFSGG